MPCYLRLAHADTSEGSLLLNTIHIVPTGRCGVSVGQAEGSHGSLIRHRQRVQARNQERAAAAAAAGGARGGAGTGPGGAAARGQNSPHRWNFLSRAVSRFLFSFFRFGRWWEFAAPGGRDQTDCDPFHSGRLQSDRFHSYQDSADVFIICSCNPSEKGRFGHRQSLLQDLLHSNVYYD